MSLHSAEDRLARQEVRAKICMLIKRILRHYGYPPDLGDAAVDLVLQQAELLVAGWVG